MTPYTHRSTCPYLVLPSLFVRLRCSNRLPTTITPCIFPNRTGKATRPTAGLLAGELIIFCRATHPRGCLIPVAGHVAVGKVGSGVRILFLLCEVFMRPTVDSGVGFGRGVDRGLKYINCQSSMRVCDALLVPPFRPSPPLHIPLPLRPVFSSNVGTTSSTPRTAAVPASLKAQATVSTGPRWWCSI